MKAEKLAIVIIVGILVLSSINSLRALTDPITREEAVEISKSSRLVQEGLAIAWKSTVVTDYYNSSMVERLKTGPAGARFEAVPEGHGAWQVAWLLFYPDKPGFFTVIVVVDANMGTLLYGERGGEFL